MAAKGNGVSGLLFALAATAVARKVVDTTWKIGAKRNPPTDPTDPTVSAREAFTFAVLSGAAMGVARMVVTRRAAANDRHDRALLAEAKRAEKV